MTLLDAKNIEAEKDGYSDFESIPSHLKMEYMRRAAELYSDGQLELALNNMSDWLMINTNLQLDTISNFIEQFKPTEN